MFSVALWAHGRAAQLSSPGELFTVFGFMTLDSGAILLPKSN